MIDLFEINWKTRVSSEASCKGADGGSGQPDKYHALLSLLDITGACARLTEQSS